ncbi:hydrogen peroxide-inducible genes activator [Gordonia sp. (in: high G+C Gram-positive bacteria)]|uniref:hydrogen peroxide-inducible genes activator n=1 Tax=Gordonia sp. (in: high G+C Gram-positive bacteria) TaxID=84139 RepID=UPI00168E251B|nr:hydrogen peroxide-inducible genes activator [Gordonia sp. (in: high G+C Gram-positive bacteria)]NLG45310.1 hydrogen peroxide-inducible genes activator [Gordonia sp. (in: high G+C Gram-positive bacteria)]
MSDQSYQPAIGGLRAFVAVAKKLHFVSAAADLGVSQPSLSQALAGLEAGLGIQLVERTTRRVMLTAEGRRLLPSAMAACDAIDNFLAEAAGEDDPLRGSIRLGLIPTIAPYILPRLLRGLPLRRPELELRVVEDQTARLLQQLRDGTLDAAVLALPANAAGIGEIEMYDEDFVLAIPDGHPLAGRKRLAPSMLADLPLLLLDEGHCLRDQALDVCQAAGVDPDLRQTRAASLTTAVQCVEGGLGVTLIPRTSVAVETASGELATAEFTKPRPGRRIGLVYRTSSGRGAAYAELAADIAELVAESGDVTPVRAGR